MFVYRKFIIYQQYRLQYTELQIELHDTKLYEINFNKHENSITIYLSFLNWLRVHSIKLNLESWVGCQYGLPADSVYPIFLPAKKITSRVWEISGFDSLKNLLVSTNDKLRRIHSDYLTNQEFLRERNGVIYF